MTHVTLSIPDSVYEEMKKHPEINWSAVARESIIEKTLSLKKKITTKELFNSLSEETRNSIIKTNEKEAKEFFKKVRGAGSKRAKYLTQA